MGRRPSNYNIQQAFMKNVTKNQITGCWEWKPAAFRFRVFLNPDSLVLNPRRYCAYLEGYNIQVGRQVMNACSNPKCVNPEHTIEKSTKKPISKYTPFILSLDEMRLGSNRARLYYGRPIQQLRDARERTLEVIRLIRRQPLRMTNEAVGEKLDVGPHFVKQVRELTKEDFHQDIKEDKVDSGFTPIDELGDELPPDFTDFL